MHVWTVEILTQVTKRQKNQFFKVKLSIQNYLEKTKPADFEKFDYKYHDSGELSVVSGIFVFSRLRLKELNFLYSNRSLSSMFVPLTKGINVVVLLKIVFGYQDSSAFVTLLAFSD